MNAKHDSTMNVDDVAEDKKPTHAVECTESLNYHLVEPCNQTINFQQ